MQNPNFICPISQQVMKDPVCDKEGNTFERSCIEEWIRLHGTSPITRTPMTFNDLVPNRALKSLIEGESVEVDSLIVVQDVVQGEIQLEITKLGKAFRISAIPPDNTNRPPVDICCVVDISGSMQLEAEFKNESGTKESLGLSVLDLVKHAVKTVIKSLNDQDRLSLVSFTNDAKVVLDLTPMTSGGQAAAMTALESLFPTASTNLWAGLETGLDTLKGSKFGSVMLFTDGVPNVEPPRGHIPMLKLYKDKNGGSYPGTINTFGFGYDLDSKLLNEIAIEGGGQYAFIPDAGFVGTVFIHSIANLLSTCSRDSILRLEGDVKVLGHISEKQSWGTIVPFGNLFYGQSKDVVVTSDGEFSVILDTNRGGSRIQLQKDSNCAVEDLNVTEHLHRLEFVDTVRDAMVKMPLEYTQTGEATLQQDRIAQLDAKIQQSGNGVCKGLLQDIQTQVKEAFQPAYFMKWGRHYIPSLLYAHLNQVCNNFKDPGVQIYGGRLFKTLRDQADELFCKLPAPVPARQRYQNSNVPHVPIAMSAFHNVNNVCFHPLTKVKTETGFKPITEICRGDCVETRSRFYKVKCVVISTTNKALFCQAGDVMITPWHPIFEDNKWIFPATKYPVIEMDCRFVFNLVLEGGHSIFANGVWCVTLGHGMDDSVCQHDYFGTEKVIKDLETFRGYESGKVFVAGCKRGVNGTGVGLIEGDEVVLEG